jgi:hypothetical protein
MKIQKSKNQVPIKKANMTTQNATSTKSAPPSGIMDQFNLDVPEDFPEYSLNPRTAMNIVKSQEWTDANPNLNLSSFVTTFYEPEEAEVGPFVGARENQDSLKFLRSKA